MDLTSTGNLVLTFQFTHPDKRRVTVSYHHPGDTFRPGILKSIIQIQVKWTEEDLIPLLV